MLAARGVPTVVVPSFQYKNKETGETDWEAFSSALDEQVLKATPDLVVLAGFMCMYQLPAALESRVMNIHPALVPAFSGQGMYGKRQPLSGD